jgi:hypothetical protein
MKSMNIKKEKYIFQKKICTKKRRRYERRQKRCEKMKKHSQKFNTNCHKLENIEAKEKEDEKKDKSYKLIY